MLVYKYNDRQYFGDFEDLDDYEDVVVTKTREQILEEYWEYWKGQCEMRNQENTVVGDAIIEITEENCIEDWITVNLAWTEEVEDAKT